MTTPVHSAVAIGVQRVGFETMFLDTGSVSRNWGPTLRGGFGLALRKVSCALGRDECKDCLLGDSCAYSYAFETPIPAQAPVMRKYTQAPHPFVFEPHAAEDRNVNSGERVSHALVVIGEAVRYLPHFFLALEELGRAGLGRDQVPYRVESIWVPGGQAIYRRQEGCTPAVRP